MHADVADLNRDGLPDLLFTTAVKSSEPSHIKNVHQDVHFFLNSGDRDDGEACRSSSPRAERPILTVVGDRCEQWI